MTADQRARTTPVERPFPFRAQDIENLIYKQPVAVLTSGEHASDIPGDWTAVMHALIRESLREFMGVNRLAEFLAGVGPNEAERSEFRRGHDSLADAAGLRGGAADRRAGRRVPHPGFGRARS